MATLGVRRMVHGHSIIADLRGIEPSEVDAPLLYCERQVLAIDGGMYAGGPCLVVSLDRLGLTDRCELVERWSAFVAREPSHFPPIRGEHLVQKAHVLRVLRVRLM